MKFPLGEVAGALGLAGPPPESIVSGWSIDSRTIEPGDLFFALRGPNHDGHSYVQEALRRGGVAAVVECDTEAIGTLLRVQSTLDALHGLAAWARQRWGGKVVAVTGSAGKTTTKEAIAHLLETEMRTGKTAGNFNNHVGLPLSILRLPDDAEVAVLEIGMNHPGEIRQLAGIARPLVGVVTNAGRAHVEFFPSAEEVALAKRELIESLPPDGVAVLNADDSRVNRFREVHPGRSISFGFSEGADVRAEEVEYGPDGVRFRVQGSGWFETALIGRHGVMNLLAGMAVAQVFGISPERLRDAVASVSAGKMRGVRFRHAGITVLDDCYNSNPDAVRLMLETLRDTPARHRLAVLGEMRELGHLSETLHREAGRAVVSYGIDVLIGIRGAARHMVEEAIKAGLPDGAAFFFETPEEAGGFARGLAREGDAVLFKGSRGTHVERALDRFWG